MDFPFDLLKHRTVDGIDGLIVAVTQDSKTGEILMTAFTNDEGIQKTMETGRVHYYSTSRKKLWLKGETSGHFQKLKDVRLDCDGDAVLFQVEQAGAACHEGYRSCFFRAIKDGKAVLKGVKTKD